MASLWLQSASLLVLLVMLCPESSSAQEPQHLCGSHLVEALNLVCGNKGFYSSTRRDVLPSNENEIKDQMGMMVKRHIVEQCCHKPCSLAVLEMYCN